MFLSSSEELDRLTSWCFEQFKHLCFLRNEGVPSFGLCASLFVYIFQKVERRACTTFLDEGETILEAEKFQCVDPFLGQPLVIQSSEINASALRWTIIAPRCLWSTCVYRRGQRHQGAEARSSQVKSMVSAVALKVRAASMGPTLFAEAAHPYPWEASPWVALLSRGTAQFEAPALLRKDDAIEANVSDVSPVLDVLATVNKRIRRPPLASRGLHRAEVRS